MQTLTLTYQAKVGDLIPVLEPEGDHYRYVPFADRVIRVCSRTHFDRDRLDDEDDFDTLPHTETVVEVERVPIDGTPYLGGANQFAPRPGDWFRWQGRLYAYCFGRQCRPLGHADAARPPHGAAVEIARLEYSDYPVVERGGHVLVTVPHPFYSDADGREVYPAGKEYAIISLFNSNPISGGHMESQVSSNADRRYSLTARPSCEPRRAGLDHTNQWRLTLQLSNANCSIVELRPVVETQVDRAG